MTRSGGSVLVVDDDADVRLFLRASLESEGYSVIEAGDGDAALKLFHETDPAAIILDLSMNQPDGLEVCRRVRHHSNVPILVHTSHSDEVNEAMCFAAGADDFLAKPATGKIIALHVTSLLNRTSQKLVQPLTPRRPISEPISYATFSEYNEEPAPRRFLWFLLSGAILVPILIFTAWLVVGSSFIPVAQYPVLAESGKQTMSTAQLIDSIKAEKLSVYWLNVKQGFSYSEASSTAGVEEIAYYPVGSTISNVNQFEVKVATYRDLALYNSQPHPLLGANGRTITLNNGATLSYDQMSPNQSLVAFPDKVQVVVIYYPANQALTTLIDDANNLALVA